MSLTNDSAVGNSISFRPATLHVNWDGVSEAQASFELACYDSAATYSVAAYPVHETSARYTYAPGNTTSTWSPFVVAYERGDRLVSWSDNGYDQPVPYIHPNITLPSTVSSGIATIKFSAITANYFTHAWTLTGTKGTVTRVLVAGGVFVKTPGPYSPGAFVGGVTASGCF
jgi:hypothetical protein